MFKRISAAVLALLMLFALTACSVSESDISAAANLANTILASDSESAANGTADTADAQTAEQTGETEETGQDERTGETEASIEGSGEYAETTGANAENPAAYDEAAESPDEAIEDNAALLDESGTYDSKEDVALYIHQYGHLPDNYITKKEAQALGWSGGSLEPYAPGKCIGGSYFGNYEGILPAADGREYHECDIDTLGASSRGAKRIVFSNDGLVYYTEDHYETFELLYGDDGQ